jgi:hypothetical protein
MNQQLPISTHQATSQFPYLDPTPIIQSESPTAVILAIAIFVSILISGITGLVRVIIMTRSFR